MSGSTDGKKSTAFNPALVIVGVLLIASNLRSPITVVAPILDVISDDLGLSATLAGMLTTLPLLAFAIVSPIASSISGKLGLERSLMLSLLLIILGVGVRSMGSSAQLFSGTCIIGVGIAIANVLIPSLFKRDFPTHVATLTALYVLVMGIFATVSSSLAVPILHLFENVHLSGIPSWALSLMSAAILPIVAVLFWLPQLMFRTKASADTAKIDSHSYLWRSKDAWQVALFLGLDAFIVYVFISWLPSILIESGYTEHQAGYIHALLQAANALSALILASMMPKIKNKRMFSVAMSVLTLVGIIGLIIAPVFAAYWVFVVGFCSGCGFVLGLSFVGTRTHNAHQTAVLSGMAQCTGYLVAATGPIIFGSLREITGSWNAPLIVAAIVCVCWIALSPFAGNPKVIRKH